ncbi:hypothetical protein CRENPOLYSF2_2310002 [Crenothrix polyspora]|uniref:Uncharacterized protein n=1 Tax=Crenothrix polyspora TaxID=360316 RepID=A0A1R4H5Z7_9GAMM|nr:hypothetical protein CRENPOLYSF2_2310002 [Crenothrix polyspora]
MREWHRGQKKGVLVGTPFYRKTEKELTVVDVHCYFKTETQISVAWCFPFHNHNLFKFSKC